MRQLEKFFNKPKVYNVIQYLLAFAGGKAVLKKIQEYIDAKPGDSVLDVGCGTGKYTRIFMRADYTGIDTSDEYLNYARRRYPFGKFINMDAAQLTFPDQSFRCVFSVSTFHHLSDEAAGRAALEMKRVCQNNGVVYIIDNVFPRKINFIGYLLFKLDRGSYQRNFLDMEKLLSPHGFRVADSKLKKSFPYRYAIFEYKKET